jgi:hypothetical protein
MIQILKKTLKIIKHLNLELQKDMEKNFKNKKAFEPRDLQNDMKKQTKITHVTYLPILCLFFVISELFFGGFEVAECANSQRSSNPPKSELVVDVALKAA